MTDFKSAMAVLPASDIGRARAFYQDKLGLTPEEGLDETGTMYSVGASKFLVYETSFAGTAKNTALTLEAADLDAAMTELRGRGIAFQEYDMPGLKTENGVASLGDERTAWFLDSEGNIIALSSRS